MLFVTPFAATATTPANLSTPSVSAGAQLHRRVGDRMRRETSTTTAAATSATAAAATAAAPTTTAATATAAAKLVEKFVLVPFVVTAATASRSGQLLLLLRLESSAVQSRPQKPNSSSFSQTGNSNIFLDKEPLMWAGALV